MGIADWFRGLLPARRVPRALPARAADTPAAAYSAEAIGFAGAGASSIRGTRSSAALLASYGSIPWLHAVVRRRAEAFAAAEWIVYRATDGSRAGRIPGMRAAPEQRAHATQAALKAGKLEQLAEHPVLDLLEFPSPGIHGHAWWELVSKYLDLAGEAPLLKSRDGTGRVRSLHPVVPTWITDVPVPGRPYFVIAKPMHGKPDKYSVNDVIWIRQHNPVDPYNARGLGTAHVLVDELETDEMMAATARSRFANGAIPEVLLGILPRMPTGTLPTKEQLEEFAKGLENKHQGPDRAGQMHLLAGDFKAQILGHTLRESQYIEGRKWGRDLTMQAYGTPPEMMGVLADANRSTIDAAADHMARYSTVPQLERVRAYLNAELVPDFGRDIVLDYVSPVPADREYEKNFMVALPGAFRIDEIRARAGEAPLPNDEGQAMYAQPGAGPSVPVPGDAPKQAAAKKKPAAAKTDDDDDKEDDDAVPDA